MNNHVIDHEPSHKPGDRVELRPFYPIRPAGIRGTVVESFVENVIPGGPAAKFYRVKWDNASDGVKPGGWLGDSLVPLNAVDLIAEAL